MNDSKDTKNNKWRASASSRLQSLLAIRSYFYLALLGVFCVAALWINHRQQAEMASVRCTREQALQLSGDVVTFARSGTWWHGFVRPGSFENNATPLARARWASGSSPDEIERRRAVPVTIKVLWNGSRPLDANEFEFMAEARCRF